MITLEQFQALVRHGEKEVVDFKLRCDMFMTDAVATRGEFAKDICAMANNGPVASYFLIGVSDDGQSYLSVSNDKLTDDNIQAFCKEALFPPPSIRVFRKRWDLPHKPFSGIDLLIIKVGPHARQVFRLNRDFVSYKQKVCYRRNEVWVRRGATSDLATPEEIGRLLKGRPLQSTPARQDNLDYRRLHREHKAPLIMADLTSCIQELGGSISDTRIVLPIRGLNFVLRVVLLSELTASPSMLQHMERTWSYEHGFIFVVVGSVTKSAFPETAEIHFKEKWGWFTVKSNSFLSANAIKLPGSNHSISMLPANSYYTPMLIFTLPSIKDTESLYSSITEFKKFLESDSAAFTSCRDARSLMNLNLRRLMTQGWIERTNRSYYAARSKKAQLPRGEFIDKRYGHGVFRRFKNAKLRALARRILSLSSSRA